MTKNSGDSIMENLFSTLKENGGKLGLAIAIMSFIYNGTASLVERSTRVHDIQQQQEKRISDLEESVRNELATRREITLFKDATDAHFETLERLIMKDMLYHHPTMKGE